VRRLTSAIASPAARQRARCAASSSSHWPQRGSSNRSTTPLSSRASPGLRPPVEIATDSAPRRTTAGMWTSLRAATSSTLTSAPCARAAAARRSDRSRGKPAISTSRAAATSSDVGRSRRSRSPAVAAKPGGGSSENTRSDRASAASSAARRRNTASPRPTRTIARFSTSRVSGSMARA
jgi:hypothetical protein